VNAEFNWWLLIVGLVIGGGLVWLVLLDSRRREDEVSAGERALEAAWLSEALAAEGTTVSPAAAERVLQLHAEYLAGSVPPADEPGPAPAAPARPAEPSPDVDPGT
jgi:hypothetical protein